MSRKPLDLACDEVDKLMLKEAAQKKKMTPYLDEHLMKIQAIDRQLNWNEKKKTELEKSKKALLSKMNELLDLAMVQTHSLRNGYKVKPDHKRKIVVKDITKFMMWLKKNKPPSEVFSFFKDSIKVAKLKSFCEKEAIEQGLGGELIPIIDGVDFGDITYRKLTTEVKK